MWSSFSPPPFNSLCKRLLPCQLSPPTTATCKSYSASGMQLPSPTIWFLPHQVSTTHSRAGGERTDLLSRAVTLGLSSATPFIVAVAGFSRGGKSFHMFSGGELLETILCYRPDVEITVKQVLTGMKHLCPFQHFTAATVRNICNKISRLRQPPLTLFQAPHTLLCHWKIKKTAACMAFSRT